MSTPGDDRDLNEFLSGRSDLSRHYRSSGPGGAPEEPPPELDRAILAQARAAVAAPGPVTPLPARKPLKWAVPFALAASMLLTVAVYREAGKDVGVDGNATSGVPAEQSVAPAGPPVVEAVPEPEQAERAAAVAVARDEAAQKTVELRAVAPSPPPASVPAPSAVVSIPAVAPAANESLAAAAEAVAPAPPAAPPASVVAAARAPAAQRASAEEARPQAGAAAPQRTPEGWLEDIRGLRSAGQGAAADEELKRFLEAYPDYFARNPGIARP